MKWRFAVLFFLVSVMGFAREYEIKFSILAPEGSTWIKVLNSANEELIRRTKGEVRFKIYAGGVSGDERDVIRKIRIGQLHAAGLTGVGLGDIFSGIRVLELPFLYDNVVEVDYVRQRFKPILKKEYEARGFIFLGWAEAGFVNIFSNRPIQSLQDMASVKMWAWEGDPLVQAMAEAYHIVPIPLSITDVMTSLQTKLIDAFYAPPLAAIALQWFSKVKYMTDLPLANATGGILMSRNYYNKLPPQYRKILNEVVEEYSEKLIMETRKDNKESYNILRTNNTNKIEFVAVSEKERQRMLDLSLVVRKKLVGKLYKNELLQTVEKFLAETRKRSAEKISTP